MIDAAPIDCAFARQENLALRYVAEGLSPEEAERFELHYLGCESCWTDVRTSNEAAAVLSKPRKRSRWADASVYAAAAAVVLAIATGLFFLKGPPESPVFEALVAAAPSERTVEARLTGGFAHRPLASVTRGGPPVASSWRLLKIIEEHGRHGDAGSPDEARAVGLAQLLSGDTAGAIRTLESARARHPKDARVASDLGAARFVLFTTSNDPNALEAAIDDAALALALDPKLTEAQFNKALFAERLGLVGTARREWARYLELDKDSGWAAEARRHLASLEERVSRLVPGEPTLLAAASRSDQTALRELAATFPDEARRLVSDRLLAEWAAGTASGDDLRAAQALADALASTSGDWLLSDSVRAIQSSAGARRTSFHLAQAAYAEGRAQQRAQSFALAAAAHRDAERRFSAVGSPFRFLAAQELASSLFDENELRQSLDVGRRVEAADRSRYPAVVARSRWLTGLAQICLGNPTESVRAYSDALALFERMGDEESAGFLHSLLAEEYRELGDLRAAAEHRRRGLAMLARDRSPTRRYVALTSAGEAAEAAGNGELARIAYLEASDVGLAAAEPDIAMSALLTAARVTAGNRAETRSYVRRAEGLLQAIADPALRARAKAELDLARGTLLDPPEAIDALAEAATFFRNRGDLGRLTECLILRGQLLERQGLADLALADYLSGIRSLETERAGLPRRAADRTSFFAQSGKLFDRAIGLLAASNQIEKTIELIETARARTLFESASGVLMPRGADAGIPPLHRMIERLDPETAVVEYAVLDDRLLILVVRAGGVRLEQRPVTATTLRSLSVQLRAGLDPSGPPEVPPAAAELYRLLVSPVRDQLVGARQLVFVPDKDLHQIPFAALRNPESGRFLIEDFETIVSPSLAIASRIPSAVVIRPTDSALVIANPRFDPRFTPAARTLLAAEREGEEVRRRFPNGRTLVHGDATRAAFLSGVADAWLIHYAGHTSSADDPLLTGLALAPDPVQRDSGVVHVEEIASMRLPSTRLVVLSACDSARGASQGPEGVMSLAQAFLASGVGAVVGTLAPVEDDAAARLLDAFYDRLVAGDAAPAALRAAQAESLRNPDPNRRRLAAWASYEIIGAAAAS